jgi:hypothetical protein
MHKDQGICRLCGGLTNGAKRGGQCKNCLLKHGSGKLSRRKRKEV